MCKKLTTTVAAMIFSFYFIFIGSHFHLVKANITISSPMIKPLTATFYIILISLAVFRFIVVYTRVYSSIEILGIDLSSKEK